MIKKVKKYTLIFLSMFMMIAFNTIGVLAADDSVLNLGTKTITDVNKTWTITFNNPIDFTSVAGNVQIKDITLDKELSINPVQGDDKSIVKVNAPSGGYIIAHNYQISVNKNIKLLNGTYLSRTTALNFIVASKVSSSGSGNNGYTISANVAVSPVISIFKQITITSTNLPGAAKYRIEGNNKLFDIGQSMFSMVSGNTVKVYVCDSQGNVLRTADMDVSATKSNMNLNLQ